MHIVKQSVRQARIALFFSKMLVQGRRKFDRFLYHVKNDQRTWPFQLNGYGVWRNSDRRELTQDTTVQARLC